MNCYVIIFKFWVHVYYLKVRQLLDMTCAKLLFLITTHKQCKTNNYSFLNILIIILETILQQINSLLNLGKIIWQKLNTCVGYYPKPCHVLSLIQFILYCTIVDAYK